MKRILLFSLIIMFSAAGLFAQNIGINADGSTPDPNAMLDIKAANKGLLIPRTSTITRISIPNTKGLLVYDSTTSSFWYNDGTIWQQISSGSPSLSGTLNYLAKFYGPSTLGNSQLFDNGQYVGIGTNTPTAGLNIIHDGGIIAKGDTGKANTFTPTETGVGAKMIWSPKRGAFRAGFLDATYGFLWDDQYTGNWSTAFGYDEFATGLGCFATGYQTSSQGTYSFSAGYNTQATRIASIAIGSGAKAEGDYSFAEGNGTTAVGVGSVAMGTGTATQGNYSFALGNNTYSGGDYSLASGSSTQATGSSSVAMGFGTKAAGDYSFAMGYTSQATALGSVSLGYGNTAGANFTFSAGSFCTANGQNSVAMGDNTTASGAASFSFGDFTKATGNYSFAGGISTVASGQLSIAMGSNSTASGNGSMIFGTNLFDGGHKGDAMLGDTDPWNAGSVGSGTDDQMICRFNNGYYFITGGNTNRTGIFANHGDNSWSSISDSTKKEKKLPVDGEALLNKISKFNLCTWNYKGQDPEIFRHYGPMAQDFHNAFGHDAIGTIGNDTLINQSDFLGVSFTAIQALEKRTEKIEQQQNEISVLEKQNQLLAENNEAMKTQLQSLLMSVASLNKKLDALAIAQSSAHSVAVK